MSSDLRLYVVHYHDKDPACPIFTWFCRAHDRDHALEKFHADGDDWEVVSVKLAEMAPR